jgi:hypothetical protein
MWQRRLPYTAVDSSKLPNTSSTEFELLSVDEISCQSSPTTVVCQYGLSFRHALQASKLGPASVLMTRMKYHVSGPAIAHHPLDEMQRFRSP